jgi:hypothetical protein
MTHDMSIIERQCMEEIARCIAWPSIRYYRATHEFMMMLRGRPPLGGYDYRRDIIWC